jgi:stress response protein YsnF
MPEEEHDTQVIPVVEETARVDKRPTVSGKVRVRTEVNSVEQVVRETLTDETVEVTRVPINRRIEQIPEVRTENGVTILPIIEERLVVEKQLFLKEELHIRRDVNTETVEVPVTLRSERAIVERLDANGQPLPEESTS